MTGVYSFQVWEDSSSFFKKKKTKHLYFSS